MAESRPWAAGELLLGPDTGSGPLVALTEPLSFWGGVDEKTGTIIEARHPQFGVCLAKTALLISATRGSSSSSSTFLECIRRGTAPTLVLLTAPDPMLVTAAAAAWEIYGRSPSIVLLSEPADAAGVSAVQLEATGAVLALASGPVS
ncbi:aconitase X swivel domain-containing protein [uncultured Jatrophihabitans sp.]|uniref:aconitase X swivel domain-containing protein n=1 Tax=uncultured Jatrophihabitans sp. TaxID=1610747 RepID=UPI0035CABAFA